MPLTPQIVDELVRACLFPNNEEAPKLRELVKTMDWKEEEITAAWPDLILVKGIARSYGLRRSAVEANKEKIRAALMELPEKFFRNEGGGASFLEACLDKHGTLWTNLHITMEALFVLGIAADMAEWCAPREMWSALPGKMPYVMVYP